MTFKQAAEFIVERRKAELDAAAAIFYDALKQNPQLLSVETELRALALAEAKKGCRVTWSPDNLGNGAVDTACNAELEIKKRALLKRFGLTDKTLSPPPRCFKCGDTARVNGDYCTCVKALALNDKQNLEIPYTSFSKIDYTRFEEAHRARNVAVYADVQKICEKYPGNKRRVIVIMGGTGTGKTLLAGCAADTFLKRGFAVAAVTAFGFVNRALKYHTTFDEQKLSHLEPLLDSDLLIIDDLGTESVLKNVTHEYLYSVLGERLNAGRLTLITSNTSQDGILSRYGDRIYSRLFDKELSYATTLGGRDLRLRE
ncbi:MAG: ATP-binding protein [Firmicutes bacterium]|nr:ATP-binding protein [Bacillota bacterium]